MVNIDVNTTHIISNFKTEWYCVERLSFLGQGRRRLHLVLSTFEMFTNTNDGYLNKIIVKVLKLYEIINLGIIIYYLHENKSLAVAILSFFVYNFVNYRLH